MTPDAVSLDQARLFGDETIATPFGVVQLEHSFPADESSVLLFDLTPAQAYFWSLPLVGFAIFRDEQARVYEAARFGDFVVFDSLREKRGIVTANLTTPYSATPPRGMAYWQVLAEILGEEPVREVDKIMMAMLEPLGIVKGEPFTPDARQTRILTEAAALGELTMRNNQVNPRYMSPYWTGTSWLKSFDFDTTQETDVKLQLDERSTWVLRRGDELQGHGPPRARFRPGLHDHQARQRRAASSRGQDLQAARSGHIRGH